MIQTVGVHRTALNFKEEGGAKMAEDKLAFIREDMANLKDSKLFINIRTIESPADAWMVVDGRKVLNFCTKGAQLLHQ
jgi:hypothetical protein